MSVTGVLAAEDAWKLAEAAAMAGTWDGEKRIISKYVNVLMYSKVMMIIFYQHTMAMLMFVIVRHLLCGTPPTPVKEL